MISLTYDMDEVNQIIIDASIEIKLCVFGRNTLYLNPETREVETLELWLDYFKYNCPDPHALNYIENQFNKLIEVRWDNKLHDWKSVL